MGVQARRRAAARVGVGFVDVTFRVVVLFWLLLGAHAFIDIRAPARADAALVESLPPEQVHLVFSSHLVSYSK